MRKIMMFRVVLLLAICVPMVTHAKDLQRIAVYVAESPDEALTTILGDQLVAAFVGHDGFIAIERTSVFLNELQKEQEYQRSGLVDDLQISELGKQFGVQLVCVAKITSAMGQNYISARMVDVESANISATAHKAATLTNLEDVVIVCSFVACRLLNGADCQQYELKTTNEMQDEGLKQQLQPEKSNNIEERAIASNNSMNKNSFSDANGKNIILSCDAFGTQGMFVEGVTIFLDGEEIGKGDRNGFSIIIKDASPSMRSLKIVVESDMSMKSGGTFTIDTSEKEHFYFTTRGLSVALKKDKKKK